MNNKFSDFVKKTKIKVALRLIVFTILVVGISLILYKIKSVLLFICLLFVGVIISGILADKERKKVLKYKIGTDVDNNFYIPLVLDNDYLNNISSQFNTPIEVPGNINSLVNYVQYMIDNNQMIFVQKNFKLDDIIDSLNYLMQYQKFTYKLNKDDIIKNDDETIALRRKDNVSTDFHDLAMIRSILESNHLELACFYAPKDGFSKFARIDGYVLAVVSIEKVDQIKKYRVELANKLGYK